MAPHPSMHDSGHLQREPRNMYLARILALGVVLGKRQSTKVAVFFFRCSSSPGGSYDSSQSGTAQTSDRVSDLPFLSARLLVNAYTYGRYGGHTYFVETNPGMACEFSGEGRAKAWEGQAPPPAPVSRPAWDDQRTIYEIPLCSRAFLPIPFSLLHRIEGRYGTIFVVRVRQFSVLENQTEGIVLFSLLSILRLACLGAFWGAGLGTRLDRLVIGCNKLDMVIATSEESWIVYFTRIAPADRCGARPAPPTQPSLG
ncbi:hypothetical protein BC827DRAFT_1156297 [Russula dissimulans]|nr:hypothetical protein BC827DRAFT_1156297 [Russula dissimulans]